MKAKYPGRCACGCGISFSPGTEIVMLDKRATIYSHSVQTPVTDYHLMENRIEACYHGSSQYSWEELAAWCERLKYLALADLCHELKALAL